MPGSAEPQLRERYSRLALGTIAVALLSGVALGSLMGYGQAQQTAASAGDPNRSDDVDALSIFDIDQDNTNLTPQLASTNFSPDSFRLMLDGADYKIYAARARSNEACILVLTSPMNYVSACSLDSEFPRSGLQVGWSESDAITYTADGAVDENSTLLLPRVAKWSADGRVTVGTTAAP